MNKWIYFFITIVFLFKTTLIKSEVRFATQEFAPFHYKINGVVSGPVADIIRVICKDMKIKYSLTSLPWPRAQKYVKEGSMHGMFIVGWNEERTKWLYFSPPVFNTEYGFFVKDDSKYKFNNPSWIENLTIGVYGPSNTSKSLRKISDKFKNVKIDMTPHDEAPFKKLSLGRVHAVFSNRDVGYALAKKNGLMNIKYVGREKKLKYYIVFSKKYNDKKFIDKFNRTYLKLCKKGVISKIIRNYSLEPAM
ncbi:MAG: amino acid ABC transporter substrate-binding protein [Desulfobacterales bacterium]|nr:amino acid ABC transporter substrate-binding protein [Desulfobacterales bacterium]MCP4161387.1 amino acid ABC transporter substrate-binding protein [Deltaproteobacteria bacterium]